MQALPGRCAWLARRVSRSERAIAGLAGWLSTPKLAMLIFLALPVFYGITSEGLTETRLRLQFARTHRRVLAESGHEGVHAE
jgi:hypothetical protein